MKKISYNPLWKQLVDHGWKKKDLQHEAGISTGTVAKLGRNENVTTAVLVKISVALDCRLEDIAEIIKETNDEVQPPSGANGKTSI